MKRPWPLLPLVIVLACTTFPATLTCADTAEERFLQGLRQRRLFHLAEVSCQRRLAQGKLSEVDRAKLVIELARTYAQHAVHSPPKDRERLWRASRDATAALVRDSPRNPRLVLAQVQDALTVLARGELARQEAEVAAVGAPSLVEVRGRLREAIGLLEPLGKRVAEMLRQRHRNPRTESGELTAGELRALQNNLQYQLARAYRNQALCYPAESEDRVNSLTLADRQLTPLALLSVEDPLSWRSRIDQIVCYRLLGDLKSAATRLDTLQADAPPIAIALRARAERVRIELAAGDCNAAFRTLAKGRDIGGQRSAELDFAYLEACIAGWQAAAKDDNQQEAAAWQERAAAAIREIEQLHGPYWMRRAEMRLASSAARVGGSGNVDVLVRTAQNSYRRGEMDDAVAHYEKAAQCAQTLGSDQLAFDLFYKAAVIEHQRERRRAAIDRFRALGLAMPRHPKAGETHLLAALNASLLAREQEPPQLDEYVALLHEHLKRWPQGASSDKARAWLGRLREHQQKWPDAIAAYAGISVDSQQYEDAIRGGARCYRQWLEQLRASGESYRKQADEAVRFFEDVILGPEGQVPERWSPVARFAAVEAARVRLRHTNNGFAAAQEVLQAALRANHDAPDQWQSAAKTLLVVSLAGQGRREDAQKVLREISENSPERLLEMLSGLSAVADTARVEDRGELARLQLDAVALIQPHRNRLDKTGQRTLALARAEALAAAGQWDQALRQYSRLAAENPTSGHIQQRYADALLEAGDPASLDKALTQWRKVARKSPPKSQRWYRAKYSVALAHYKLGNKQQAANLIRYLRALHPDLGGPAMQKKFLHLLAQCERPQG